MRFSRRNAISLVFFPPSNILNNASDNEIQLGISFCQRTAEIFDENGARVRARAILLSSVSSPIAPVYTLRRKSFQCKMKRAKNRRMFFIIFFLLLRISCAKRLNFVTRFCRCRTLICFVACVCCEMFGKFRFLFDVSSSCEMLYMFAAMVQDYK